MPEPEIRPYRSEDAELAVPLFRTLIPDEIQTGPAIDHWIASQPARAGMRAWTALVDDEVVGWANARLRWSLEAGDVAGGWVGVLPAHRRSGLGSALYRLVEDHARALGARRLTSFAMESDRDGPDFAARRGFREGRRDQSWELDVANAALRRPAPPPEAKVVRLRSVRDRERDLFELYDAAHGDMPGDDRSTLEFDEWQPETLGNPTLDLDVSAVVFVEDRPAALAWVNSDRVGGVGVNELTGTHPDFRRRGLARLAKEASILWAAEAGIATLFTANDTTNADMLALNEHLGYRPTHVQLELTKVLDGRESGP